jgi:hypothetical protein
VALSRILNRISEGRSVTINDLPRGIPDAPSAVAMIDDLYRMRANRYLVLKIRPIFLSENPIQQEMAYDQESVEITSALNLSLEAVREPVLLGTQTLDCAKIIDV